MFFLNAFQYRDRFNTRNTPGAKKIDDADIIFQAVEGTCFYGTIKYNGSREIADDISFLISCLPHYGKETADGYCRQVKLYFDMMKAEHGSKLRNVTVRGLNA